LVVPGAAGETIIVEPSGDKVTLSEGEIETTKPSKQSSMPASLLDTLTLEEIADLFAYLQRSKEGGTLTRRPVESSKK
jgi:hypothetical protein